MTARTNNLKRKLLRIALLIPALITLWVFRQPLASLWAVLQDQQAISAYVQSLGPLGLVVLFLLLVAQVFVAVIPGHALMMAGGYVFGPVVAISVVAASTILGSQVAFLIARRYGRPVIYRLAKPDVIQRWDRVADRQGSAFFFFTFILPFFPSDLMCYVAGLGTVSPRGFLVANIAGRSLTAIAMTLIGVFGFRPPWQFWVIAAVGMTALFLAWLIYKNNGITNLGKAAHDFARGMSGKINRFFHLQIFDGNVLKDRLFRVKKSFIPRSIIRSLPTPEESMNAQTISRTKLTWIFIILAVTFILAGSVFGVDWANYFLGTSALYPAIGKPVITLLAMVLVLSIGKNKLNNKDWRLLFAAFCCMLPTDILMSVVVVSPSLSVGSWVFMVGGVLSIIAHIFLIARLAGHGAPAWKTGKNLLARICLPVLIYGSAAVILILLWPDVVRVGHAAIAPAYTAFFCTTMWFAWETVRHKLLPKPNAWMAAIAATCWFGTEITGEIYNLGLGNISEIMFRLVWVFYGTNVVLWALSGFRWKE